MRGIISNIVYEDGGVMPMVITLGAANMDSEQSLIIMVKTMMKLLIL